ncbi:catalase-like [Bradysia coprophila]|uniref:catalase-like n=1 Tax=Bradysia coprophila TaxID=38358 RepID=UPI00187DACC2|nr:catalase-like [Bradysia coprophila]XP_037035589.1 catalase-like [Bradysia coprophila]XP_037035590.1 catalase-like [Bradysia coprophila]
MAKLSTCCVVLLSLVALCRGQSEEDEYCTTASNQLMCLKMTQDRTDEGDPITTEQGQPIGDIANSKTSGARGPSLIEDPLLLKELAKFDRERIPERVVHAKGAGAYGKLSITTNFLERYSKAAVFRNGASSPLFLRFSQVAGELGSQDTIRDVRGFAIKVKSTEGIWDLVGNNLPVFFIRDARLFPSFIHSQKRNPQTHIRDPNMVWDFLTLRNESTLMVLHLYSDLGTPASYRKMNGFGVHTFKLVDSQGNYVFARFNFRVDQELRNMTAAEAMEMAGRNPDYLLQDLYENIAQRNYPSWTFTAQILTPQQANTLRFNPFDPTKIWFTDEIPEYEVGKLILNENHNNYFAEVEQSAFDPANMPPGIEPSPDKLLQGRLFSYLDTQYYRLGVNFNHLPVNRPLNTVVANSYRDGHMIYDNDGGMPNYNPNSFMKASPIPQYKESAYNLDDVVVDRHEPPNDNFFQAVYLYESFSETDKDHLAENLATDLRNVFPFIRERALQNFEAVSSDLVNRLQRML